MKLKKSSSFLLCLMLALSLLLTACSNAEVPQTSDNGHEQNVIENVELDPIVVIAGSDMQNPDGNEAGKAVVENILNVMSSNGISEADGFLFCGDYDYDTYGDETETLAGLNALQSAISNMVTGDQVYAKGNHDSSASTEGISPSGNNDNENYGVFVINENDYMWYNSNEAKIKQTTENLVEYLNEKLEEGYNKPIFVISHLALHYSMRTLNDGDGTYANYIFNALNEAGEKGLNIIFMYGHDHSNGWDDYLGGAAVYLAKGDKILIAQANRSNFYEETLNFTYLNAGFIGYYSNVNGACDTLSMTSFVIEDDNITVTRYSQESVIDLKSEGVPNFYKNESGYYSPDTRTYSSPQTIDLTEVSDRSPLSDPFTVKYTEPEEDEEPEEDAETYIEEEDLTGELTFTKVMSLDELEDGGKYVFVFKDSGTHLMVPEVVRKANSAGAERIGFDIVSTSLFNADSVTAELGDCAWTLVKTDNGWKIGTPSGFIKFTQTADTAITATLEEKGDTFTISGSNGSFTFSSGSYVLNYNSRGLINGYASNPASFYIYKLNK